MGDAHVAEGSKAIRVMLVLGGVGILVIAGLRYVKERRETPRDTIPTFGGLPDFSLINEQGAKVDRSDLLDKVWIADFIFTSCAGPCPLMSQRMADLQDALKGMDDVRLVSFSVDPERDTPEVLKAYGERFGARADRWSFLTGDRKEIYELAIRGFKLAVDADPEDESLIIHSTKFVLADRRSNIRGYYDGTDPADVARLVTDVRRLVSQGRR